jgi:hydroxymethylglutaryl-CoA lyase
MDLPRHLSIREVGPRDGLQNEPGLLTTEQKAGLIAALASAGLAEIEVGSFVRPDTVPQMADTDALCARLPRRPALRYVGIAPNAVGARRAVAARVDTVQIFLSASESHNQSNVNMPIERSLQAAAEVSSIVRGAGLSFEAVLSVAFGCPYEGDVPLARVVALCRRLLDMGTSQITLGDTTGMAHPLIVRAVVLAFREAFPHIPLRLHLHSARGAGLANVLAGLQLGVDRFDSSVGGIGGCPFAPGAPGNLCTEDLVHLLHEMGIATGLSLPRLMDCARSLESMLGREVPGQLIKAGICKHLPADGSPRP